MHKEVIIFAISCFGYKIASCWLMFGQISDEVSLFPLVWFLIARRVVLLILNPRETKFTKMHPFHKVYHTIYINKLKYNSYFLEFRRLMDPMISD